MKNKFKFQSSLAINYEVSFDFNPRNQEISNLEVYCPQHDHLGEISNSELGFGKKFDCKFTYDVPFQIQIFTGYNGSNKISIEVFEIRPVKIFSQNI